MAPVAKLVLENYPFSCICLSQLRSPHFYCIIHLLTMYTVMLTRCDPLMLCTHSILYARSSPGSKAVGEDVPMDANPAYGEVNVYDTVEDHKEN